jgi:drug/metabolite transporter (DMT)-like permease
MSPNINQTAPKMLVIIAFTTVYLVWGSTYFFIRVAMQGGIPPFILGALRFILAGLIMLAWCAIRGEKLFVAKDILPASISGILLLSIATGIVIWTEKTLPSAMVAILVSSAPIWFVVLDKPMWQTNFSSRSTLIGLVIGFLGIILLFSEQIRDFWNGTGAQSKLPWMILLVFGSIAWSVGSLYSKKHPPTVSASANTGWQMLTAGIAYIPVIFLHGDYQNFQWHDIHTSGWLAVAYLIVFGSLAGFSAYVWLLQVRPATQVSTYAYVNPVIAVFLGVIFAGESISLIQIAGLATILGSVLLINLAKYRKSVVSSKQLAVTGD